MCRFCEGCCLSAFTHPQHTEIRFSGVYLPPPADIAAHANTSLKQLVAALPGDSPLVMRVHAAAAAEQAAVQAAQLLHSVPILLPQTSPVADQADAAHLLWSADSGVPVVGMREVAEGMLGHVPATVALPPPSFDDVAVVQEPGASTSDLRVYTPYLTVLKAEVVSLNRLLQTVRGTLRVVACLPALEDNTNPDSGVYDVGSVVAALAAAEAPSVWRGEVWVPKVLSKFWTWLHARAAMLTSWCDCVLRGIPTPEKVWLPGLHSPSQFLAAVTQVVASSQGWEVNCVELVCTPLTYVERSRPMRGRPRLNCAALSRTVSVRTACPNWYISSLVLVCDSLEGIGTQRRHMSRFVGVMNPSASVRLTCATLCTSGKSSRPRHDFPARSSLDRKANCSALLRLDTHRDTLRRAFSLHELVNHGKCSRRPHHAPARCLSMSCVPAA